MTCGPAMTSTSTRGPWSRTPPVWRWACAAGLRLCAYTRNAIRARCITLKTSVAHAGLFPHAHRLQDISSSEDGRSVSADATRSAAKDLFGAAPAGPADDVLSRDLSDVGLATSTRRADETVRFTARQTVLLFG